MCAYEVKDIEVERSTGSIPDVYVWDEQEAQVKVSDAIVHELFSGMPEKLYLCSLRRFLKEWRPETGPQRDARISIFLNNISRYVKTSASLEAFPSVGQSISAPRDMYSETAPLRMWFRQFAQRTPNESDDVLGVVDLRLARMKRLEDGWLGEDSLAPTPDILADAKQLLAMLNGRGVQSPILSASDDGVIHFDWRAGDRKASIRIEGDGTYGYALYVDGRYLPGEADGDLSTEELPQDLSTYLDEITRNV